MKKQIRVQITPYASARVDEDCPKETLAALSKMVEIAYNSPITNKIHMKSARTLIENISIDRANLGHIAKTGKINGSLLASLEQAMKTYAEQAIDQCASAIKNENYEYDNQAQEIRESILNVKSLLK